MSIILETDDFSIIAPTSPHIDRADGGHIIISPKKKFSDRTGLPPLLAKKLMMLTIVVGKAMKTILNKHGVDVERINYQENGNWSPILHEHLYGRAKSSKIQKFGEALYFPNSNSDFYSRNIPLTKKDVLALRKEIRRLLQDEYLSF